MGFFTKLNKRSDSVADELLKYAIGVRSTYAVTFRGMYTSAELQAQAEQAVNMLGGYAPSSHRPITKKDLKTFKKMLDAQK